MDDNPLVSVVIPTYNAADFVREAVCSVVAQDYRPLELVVVDDASTDTTPAVLESLRDLVAEAGLRLVLLRHQQNRGAAAALALGFGRAEGVLLAWLSADDAFIEPWKISKQVSFMRGDDCGVSYYRAFRSGPSSGDSVPITGHWIYPRTHWLDRFVEASPSRTLAALWFGNAINGSSSMVRRDVYERAGGFDPSLRNVDADADLWMRCLVTGSAIRGIDGLPLFYRIHSAQTTQSDPQMASGSQATRLRLIRELGERQLLLPILEATTIVLWMRGVARAAGDWPSPAREIVRQIDASRLASGNLRAFSAVMRRRLRSVPVQAMRIADRADSRAEEIQASPVWHDFVTTLQR